MTPVQLTEDRIPRDGIEETIAELVDLYGGEMKAERDNERDFVLPLRRGVATAGGGGGTVSWAPGHETTVAVVCNRGIRAPKAPRGAVACAPLPGRRRTRRR